LYRPTFMHPPNIAVQFTTLNLIMVKH
jgi:hypothetical protein